MLFCCFCCCLISQAAKFPLKEAAVLWFENLLRGRNCYRSAGRNHLHELGAASREEACFKPVSLHESACMASTSWSRGPLQGSFNVPGHVYVSTWHAQARALKNAFCAKYVITLCKVRPLARALCALNLNSSNDPPKQHINLAPTSKNPSPFLKMPHDSTAV